MANEYTITETLDIVNRKYNVDLETGLVTYKTKPGNNKGNIGDVAGTIRKKDGYVHLHLEHGVKALGHRIVWLVAHGTWPKYDLDHIDGNTSNNRLDNLRDILHSENCQNQKTCHHDNSSGYPGVSWDKNNKCFMARITVNYKAIFLGNFPTAEEAYEAYLTAKQEKHIK